MTFRVGQKVVAVSQNNRDVSVSDLVVGQIYTIRDIDSRAADAGYHDGELTIRLEEIFNPVRRTTIGDWEAGYVAHRFRPVVEHKTDISVFTAMLTPSKQGVEA